MLGIRKLTTVLAAVAPSAYALANVATVKTLAVSGGHTYSYTIAPSSYGRATYLLLHGFPSSSYDWRHTIRALTAESFGVVAPDLLGYGASSKPTAVEEYSQEKISGHVVEILQHEGISGVVGVGHDWYVFRHKTFLATPYSPVGPSPINLTAINTQTRSAFGHPIYGYWGFFNETDAASVMDKHHESFTSLLYPGDAAIWKTDVCPVGSLRKWLDADKKSSKPGYITDGEWSTHDSIMLGGGYTGPLNWYRAAMAGLNRSPTLNTARQSINKRVIFISGADDAVGRPELAEQTANTGRKSGLLPDVETFVVPNAGHWLQIEQSFRVSTILKSLDG
ncbi:alpha/beta-hydrolase [Karstenula rhodostoma CBS 690.94]|uniref:Alpha/beta-hydrolase n=1 Tax=Karstenula rhodostoma CBS 690.94 TaxID=1392251 RepID=A0A9P4U9I7_9PLEO|nr:alpha/beta-hydrolase [Karstenula rhodostoma CBS 690.94]